MQGFGCLCNVCVNKYFNDFDFAGEKKIKMLNVRANERQKASGSPKVELGEIDTRAPFQSVKAAVSLFGQVLSKRKKPIRRTRTLSSEVLSYKIYTLIK